MLGKLLSEPIYLSSITIETDITHQDRNQAILERGLLPSKRITSSNKLLQPLPKHYLYNEPLIIQTNKTFTYGRSDTQKLNPSGSAMIWNF
jgi:hypothetical protein